MTVSTARTLVLTATLGVSAARSPSPLTPGFYWGFKDPGDVLDYSVSLAAWLADIADTIATAVCSITPTSASVTTATVEGGAITTIISGGVVGQRYGVPWTVTTTGGRTVDFTVWLDCEDRNAQPGQNAAALGYQLPVASTAELGGIIVGNDLTINAGGTLSAIGGSGNIPAGTTADLLGASGTAGTANLIVLGSGVTLTAGTLSAGGGAGSVTEVVAGTGLAGGTITSTGTISLDAATGSTLGGVIAGAGLAVNAGGTLSNAGVLTITAGAGIGITGTDTISNTGVLSLGTIVPAGAAGELLGATGTLNDATPVTLGEGLAISGGTLNNTGVLSLGTIVPGTATGSLLGTDGTLNSSSAVVVGANLTLASGTLSSANPGTGTVTSVVAGTGLGGGTITSTGTLTLEPASETVLGGVVVGSGLAVNAGGTISSTAGGGSVTDVATGAGLSGGPITGSGTISLDIASAAQIGGVVIGAGVTVNAGGTISVAAPGTGTVTSVVAGAGLSGGTITGGGTVALAAIAAGDLLANTSTVAAAPSAVTPSALLDDAFGATQGDVLYRGASGWVVLAPGSAGQALESGGASANPAWKTSIPAGSTLDLLGTSGTLGEGVAVVVGAGLGMASETLSNSGVLALGGTAGSIALGTNLSITTGTLNAAGGGGGSTTIDTGAGLAGGPISTSGTIYAATPVTTTYTASGTIAVSDVLSLVNAASAAAMTLAAGAVDGHCITVKRFGAGTVTVAATIDGASETVEMTSSTVKEALSLTWNAANTTWLLV